MRHDAANADESRALRCQSTRCWSYFLLARNF
jgi:hypothetical protein